MWDAEQARKNPILSQKNIAGTQNKQVWKENNSKKTEAILQLKPPKTSNEKKSILVAVQCIAIVVFKL